MMNQSNFLKLSNWCKKISALSFVLIFAGCCHYQNNAGFAFNNLNSVRDRALDLIKEGKITIYICDDGRHLMDIPPEEFEADELEETKQLIKDENAKLIQISDVKLASIEYLSHSKKHQNIVCVNFIVNSTYDEYFHSSDAKYKSSSFEIVTIEIDSKGECLDFNTGVCCGPKDSF